MRRDLRIQGVRDIALKYEGNHNEISVRCPDISSRGMFVNTVQKFPEGAVLNLRFRLAYSGVEIQTRGEVRYCLPGVGVGVEFVGLSRKAVQAIEKEVLLGTNHARKGNSRKSKSRSRSKRR